MTAQGWEPEVTNIELIEGIFREYVSFAEENLRLMIKEAEKRSLIVSFHRGKIVISQ